MADPPLEDWLKARDWLMNEKVTRTSAKAPCLADLTKEFELYTYLKDGTELCRMIGLVTRGTVLEGIVYRTNNISTLEEKNIKMFLNHVDTELKIKRAEVFKGKDEQVFGKFEHFHIALAGLALISRKLESKIGVAKFESRARETTVRYEDDEAVEIYEGGGRDDSALEHYDQIYSKQVMEEVKASSLDMAITEMINFNDTYISRVLENIKTNFIDKNTCDILRRHFFPVIHIDKLLALHNKMQTMFEKLEYSYIEIGPIFEELKDDFIVYCEITARMKAAVEFLADQMTENQDVNEKVNNLEREAASKTKDSNISTKILDLIQMIPQHVMRYHLVIEAIQKQASKTKRTEVEQEARRAHKTMRNLGKHMEQVTNDYRYIEAMEILATEIVGLERSDLHKYGTLQSELKDVLMSSGQDTGNFTRCHLYIFSEHIVALEMKIKEEFTGEVNWVGLPIRKKVQYRKFSKSFHIKDIDAIIIKQVGKDNILHAKSFTDMKLDPNKGFFLKFADPDEASRTENAIGSLMEECKKKIYPGTEHRGHQCQKYRASGRMGDWVRCGSQDCNELLLGLLFTAVQCNTCKKAYHIECFCVQKREEDVEVDFFVDPVNLLIEKPDTLKLEDIDIGEAAKRHVMQKMKNRKPGTFLLRYSKKRRAHVISVKNFDEDKNKPYNCFMVETVNICGEKYYYIEKGTVARSLLELVQMHRKSHDLYRPVMMMSPCGSDDESGPDDETKIETVTMEENFSEAHSVYFFGDITSTEAGTLLKGKDHGTFLLRQNDGVFKLSWLTFKGNLMHAPITAHESGDFSLTSVKKFPTIHHLVLFYKKWDQSNKLALGFHLTNPKVEEESMLNKTDTELEMQRHASRKNEPHSISYYQGTMSEKEAQMMLQKEAEGTFLIREENNEFFISHKINHTVQHIPVESCEMGYSVATETTRVTKSSLRRLVDYLREEKVFLVPLDEAVRTAGRFASRQPSIEGPSPPSSSQNTPVRLDSLQRADGASLQAVAEALEPGGGRFPNLGQLSNGECEELLRLHAPGAWILRYNMKGEERISLKKDDKVVHIKIFRSDTGARLKPSDKLLPFDTLIQKLIDQETLGTQLTS